jgi:hypothetical protein
VVDEDRRGEAGAGDVREDRGRVERPDQERGGEGGDRGSGGATHGGFAADGAVDRSSAEATRSTLAAPRPFL